MALDKEVGVDKQSLGCACPNPHVEWVLDGNELSGMEYEACPHMATAEDGLCDSCRSMVVQVSAQRLDPNTAHVWIGGRNNGTIVDAVRILA